MRTVRIVCRIYRAVSPNKTVVNENSDVGNIDNNVDKIKLPCRFNGLINIFQKGDFSKRLFFNDDVRIFSTLVVWVIYHTYESKINWMTSISNKKYFKKSVLFTRFCVRNVSLVTICTIST